ncbi:hypothetical protein [Halosimplex pelagicum]|uniref:Right-handed parallel beta-helix repeat-containing protein n=1 Tax=Halosimplex pelagicum TaxID=869886 RepID=A0A7D5P9K6_9EURY|nr:hypothetical protein [Halosimplex pelagicum]QLH81185.1 hypothetical protein HZS54_05815 [Halosimplex pelagicum]
MDETTNRDREGPNASETNGDSGVKRRHVIASLAGAAISIPSGTGPYTTERAAGSESEPVGRANGGADGSACNPSGRRESSFGNVVDVRRDLDCDATGEEDCAPAIQDALDEDSLLVFPEGNYLFESGVTVGDGTRVGFHGCGDVSLVPTRGFNDTLLNLTADRVSLRNVDIDVTEPETTAGLRCISDESLLVDSVTYHGRGTHPDDAVEFALYLALRNSDARGTVRNVVAEKGSAIGHYKNGDGRGGIWVGEAHSGALRVRDCLFAEFGNNGIYGSRCSGTVEVTDCEFRNNSPSNVRISGDGSYVEDTSVTVDLDAYDGPMTGRSNINPRGVVVEAGSVEKPPGALVRRVRIDIRNVPQPVPAVLVWPTGQTVRVVDSEIRTRESGPAVYRTPQVKQGSHDPSDHPRRVVLDGVTIDAKSANAPVVDLYDAPGSVIRDCTIQQQGTVPHAIRTTRSPRTVIAGGTVVGNRTPCRIGLSSDRPSGTDYLYLADGATLRARSGGSGELRTVRYRPFDGVPKALSFAGEDGEVVDVVGVDRTDGWVTVRYRRGTASQG